MKPEEIIALDELSVQELALSAPIDWATPQWTSKFDEIKPQLKTGDIILVHGRYPGSWLVRKLQGSKWGHVCMVVRKEDLPPAYTSGFPDLMLWESNTLMEGAAKNLWPNTTSHNQVKDGPMLISLEERLHGNEFNDPTVEVALKSLHCPYKVDFSRLPEIFDAHIHKKFPESDRAIIASVYLGRRKNSVSKSPENTIKGIVDEKTNIVMLYDLNSNAKGLAGPTDEHSAGRTDMYCSELIAATFKELGLLTHQYVSNAYTPMDFSDRTQVRFLKNITFLPEQYFTML